MEAQKKDVWADIKEFPRQDWAAEVHAGDTQQGYWAWVDAQLDARDLRQRDMLEGLPAEDVVTYLEFARMALVPPACYAFAAAADISDEEVDRLRNQLNKHMGDPL
jgi:hypothetical protein